MYTVIYDINGNPNVIQNGNNFIPIDNKNMDFLDFLEWNNAQIVPLNWKTSISPTPLSEEFLASGSAIANFKSYSTWMKTYSSASAGDYINSKIWNGYTIDQINTYIDSNVVDLASAKIAMKQIANAIIDVKSILILISKLLMCIRDITIRYR